MKSKRPKKNAKRVAPKKNSSRNSRAYICIGFVLGITILGVLFVTNRKKVPRPKLPEKIEQLDTEVVALIKSQFDKIDADPKNPDVYSDLGLIYEANEFWHDALAPLIGVRPEYIQASFDAVREDWGDFDGYLAKGLGITDAEREAICENLLE